MMRFYIFIISFLFILSSCRAGELQYETARVVTGAERIDLWQPLLSGKKIALIANQSSLIGKVHLVDTMLALGIDLRKVFAPEHGFRGTADAGQLIEDGKDLLTGLPVVSLYGKHKKPFPDDLKDIDVVIFDIQDAGARFYTYISTMHYAMEACAENGKEFMIFDRPNPNAHYVDGPVLEMENQSFVGMHPVPVVHGMTVGEFAGMINGEGWLSNGIKCSTTVIRCENYNHNTEYILPVPPSPNLPNQQSIYLYPSLAFFEGTVITPGRGTDFPFQVFGHPQLKSGEFYFTPESKPGAALNPPYKDLECRGVDLRNYTPENGIFTKIELGWLIWSYKNMDPGTEFFNNYFIKLAGTGTLRNQIEAGISEEEIRQSWEPGLEIFRNTRQKYLLYKDF